MKLYAISTNYSWGPIPLWAKDKDFRKHPNARIETVDEKPALKKQYY
jgi:putative SOS response-associated peptidase YedK